MSVKGPPLIEISSTPPSKLDSRMYLFRNVMRLAPVGHIRIGGETNEPSLMVGRSGANAALGTVSGVLVVVVHGLVPIVVQPSGKAGAITPSKFSAKLE